jgi:hypothetical protein
LKLKKGGKMATGGVVNGQGGYASGGIINTEDQGGEYRNTKMDTAVAGVISANPAFRMNCEAGEDSTHPYVALAGRVPCRVAGKIKKGDMLVSSGIAGVAIATDNPRMGSMIGKALEDYDSDHIGTIEIVVGRA